MSLFSLVALSDRRGRLLVQERDAGAPVDPLRWGLPGGAREDGETPLDAARRELEEETGVSGIDLVEICRARHFHPATGWFEFSTFGAVTDLADDDVECREGRQMVFRHVDDLWMLDLASATARILPQVLASPPYSAAYGPARVPLRRRFAGVLLVDRDGRILLQERDEHPVIDPERWGLPGGHVEPDEEFAAAAHRELAEETGVVLPLGALELWGEFIVDHREPYGSWDCMQVFVAAVDLDDDDIDCREGRRIVFVPPGRARALDLTAAAVEIVPAFLDSPVHRRLSASGRVRPPKP